MIYKISVACLIMHGNSLLMIKEVQNKVLSWDIPAGGIEISESLEESLRREILEETTLSIETFELVRIFQFIEESKTTVNFLYLSHLDKLPEKFNTSINSAGLDIDEEILDLKFFSLNEIEELIRNNLFEHELAKQRLSVFVENDFEPNLIPIVIK